MCISKPFKGVLRNFWEDYVANTVIKLPETEQQRESFKIPSPSRQDTVNWIAEGINYLKSHPDMIQNVCGITTNDPGKVRNGEFLKKIMNSNRKPQIERQIDR